MCGRFFVDAKNREIDRLLAMLPEFEFTPKTGQIYPAENALVLTDGATPASMSWGFPRHDGKGVIFNARAESALQKPLFAKSLRARPVAIPTNGFYEWHAPQKETKKEKFIFTNPSSSLLYLAGFWNSFEDGPNVNPRRFTILTTDANPSVLPFHHRMPVLLQPDDLDGWLSGVNPEKILQRQPFALHAEKV